MQVIWVLMSVLAFSMALVASPVSAEGLQDEVDQAATIVERFQAMPEKAIPAAVLKDAKGLAIMTVFKAGFVLSGRGGKGVVVARTKNGWSGHSAIGTGGGALASRLVLG